MWFRCLTNCPGVTQQSSTKAPAKQAIKVDGFAMCTLSSLSNHFRADHLLLQSHTSTMPSPPSIDAYRCKSPPWIQKTKSGVQLRKYFSISNARSPIATPSHFPWPLSSFLFGLTQTERIIHGKQLLQDVWTEQLNIQPLVYTA